MREAVVRRAVELLPTDSWLKQYVLYAERQVDSHVLYHVAVGLATLSVTCSRALVGEGAGFKRRTLPNFYAWIVGKTGDAEKSIAMDVALDLLADAAPELHGPEPTAEPALARALAAQPNLLFVYSEGGKFLATTSGRQNPVGHALRKGFTDFFDGRSLTRQYSKAADKPIVVQSPRPSLLAACTPSDLENYTLSGDWEGGFLNRFFIAYGDKERSRDEPVPLSDLKLWLIGWLRRSAKHPQAGPCLGMDRYAKAVWDEWRAEMQQTYAAEARSDTGAGLLARSRLIAAKISVLSCWSTGRAWGPDPWWVDETHMRASTALASLHLESAFELVKRIQPSEEMREQQRVLQAIQPDWTAAGTVLQSAKLVWRRAKNYLETLEMQGLITSCNQGGTMYYRLVQDGAPRPFDDTFQLPPAPPAVASG